MPSSRHDMSHCHKGCFILEPFGWFGFNPSSTPGMLPETGTPYRAVGRCATDAWPGWPAAWLHDLHVASYGKPDASMSGNGLLAVVAITAPSGCP